MATATVEPGELNLVMYRGDGYTLELTFTDDADPAGPLPLEGSFDAQLRTSPDGAQLASFTIDDSQADPDGILILDLPHATVATLPLKLVWDLQQTLDDGVPRTLLAGAVVVRRDVTRPA